MSTNLLIVSFLVIASSAHADPPQLRSGDIIFQSSKSNQSYAIMWASKSLYSHVGIVEVSGKNKYVIEAIAKVSRTPLDKWVKRGRMGYYAIYRYNGLSDEIRQSIVGAANGFLGRKYDLFFNLNNKEIYCSELVDLAYEKAGAPIGKKQKIKDLDVDNKPVRALAKKRWKQHPLCKGKKLSFDGCWAKILEDEIITPAGLTEDSHLVKVWTNYP
jgi:hypothetical protein